MLPVKQFVSFINQNHLFNTGDKILAAVSGGIDSILMVHLLKAAGYNFGIAHCNFQLRGNDAMADQQFCAALAAQLNVSFHTVNFDTTQYAAAHKVSIQMAARELRYQWFEEISLQSGYPVIALAHHQNDTIETILLNLVRGTGIAGLHGILPMNGQLVRPLLFLTKEEITAIVEEAGLSYREDSSNTSTKYARNKIRLEVIPKLKELNPALENTFTQNLQRFKELEQMLQLQVAKLTKELFSYHNNEVYIPIAAVKELKPQRLLLYNLLLPYGFNETMVADLISVLDKHPGRVFETAAYSLVLDRDKLIISPKTIVPYLPVIIEAGTHSVIYGDYHLTLLHDDTPLIVKDNPMATSVDSSLLLFPLTLRAWQTGDYFYPLGMKTRKKVSDFFINQKISLHQKHKIPLLINGNGEVIWIGGYRPDERYKVNDNTEKVVIFELTI